AWNLPTILSCSIDGSSRNWEPGWGSHALDSHRASPTSSAWHSAPIFGAPSRSTEKKLAAFSALGGGFLRVPLDDRRCNRTRASVGNAGGNARPSLTNATLAASRLLHRRSPTAVEALKSEVQADGFANKLTSR